MFVFCNVSSPANSQAPLAKKNGRCVGGLFWPPISTGSWRHSRAQILILGKIVISLVPWPCPAVPRKVCVCEAASHLPEDEQSEFGDGKPQLVLCPAFSDHPSGG